MAWNNRTVLAHVHSQFYDFDDRHGSHLEAEQLYIPANNLQQVFSRCFSIFMADNRDCTALEG